MLNKNYNKNLRTYASQNRKQMTKAEACIWKYALKSSIRNGFTFRRQRPIDKYIVDFVCLELNLIIEVDGGTHNIESINRNDSIRQTELESLAFTLIRFTDDEVLKNLDGVIFKIDGTIEMILSSAGGGGWHRRCQTEVDKRRKSFFIYPPQSEQVKIAAVHFDFAQHRHFESLSELIVTLINHPSPLTCQAKCMNI